MKSLGPLLLLLVAVTGCAGTEHQVVPETEEQAVLIHVPVPEDPDAFGIDLLEDPIMEAVEAAGVGELDGNLIGPDDAILYLYGPDADALLRAVVEALNDAPVPAGTYAIKRYGDPGAREVRVELTP